MSSSIRSMPAEEIAAIQRAYGLKDSKTTLPSNKVSYLAQKNIWIKTTEGPGTIQFKALTTTPRSWYSILGKIQDIILRRRGYQMLQREQLEELEENLPIAQDGSPAHPLKIIIDAKLSQTELVSPGKIPPQMDMKLFELDEEERKALGRNPPLERTPKPPTRQ